MVTHTFNPRAQGAEVGGSMVLCEFEASLVYRVRSRAGRATEKLCLKNKQNKANTQKDTVGN